MSEETDVKEIDVKKTLDVISAKIDELSNSLKEKKAVTEEKIKENPLAYVAGAFAGGLIVGYLMARKD